MNDFFKIIKLTEIDSKEPKYKQLVNTIIESVHKGQLRNGLTLPSINEMSRHFSIARGTVRKAYDILKEKGIIVSAQGKSFTIYNESYINDINVFIMLDALNEYKSALYNGIKDGLKDNSEGKVDFYFHHCNPERFVQFLQNNEGKYEYFVVIPFEDQKVKEAIEGFDQSKLLLLDRCPEFGSDKCCKIRQSHYSELIRVLSQGKELIKKYNSFKLCFPQGYNIPEEVKLGFNEFCNENQIQHKIIDTLTHEDITRGSAYLVMEDFDLVTLFEVAEQKSLQAGKDIGIISYNNTPLKRIIERGVSVISIDFYQMGQQVAQQILKRGIKNQLIPTELIIRNTL